MKDVTVVLQVDSKFSPLHKVGNFRPRRHSSVCWAFTCGAIGLWFESHLCLVTGMWKRLAQQPCYNMKTKKQTQTKLFRMHVSYLWKTTEIFLLHSLVVHSLLNSFFICFTVAHLGFPRGGHQERRRTIIRQNFPKNCKQLKKIGPREGGRASKICLCRSAADYFK